MSLLHWEEKYSVKIKKFDEQHQELLYLINEINENIKLKKEKSELVKIISKLVQYTNLHFKEEEKLMQEYQYPDIESHLKEHEKLISEVNLIREKLDTQGNLLNVQLLYILKDWLLNHIMKTDFKYSEFFNSKGIS